MRGAFGAALSRDNRLIYGYSSKSGGKAGIDILDTAISSMSQTYGHTPTETVVAMLQDTPRDTQLKLEQLEPIAAYFRDVRKKYAKFEGQLKGVDSRILIAQVPGGMLTNMESQLKEQGAAHRIDEVLEEIHVYAKSWFYPVSDANLSDCWISSGD